MKKIFFLVFLVLLPSIFCCEHSKEETGLDIHFERRHQIVTLESVIGTYLRSLLTSVTQQL